MTTTTVPAASIPLPERSVPSVAQPRTAVDYEWLRDPTRADWFWSRVLIGTSPGQDHWLWIGEEGTWLPSGHRRIWYFGTRWLAHRLAYVLAGGDLDDGELIRHRCPGEPRPDCMSIFHLSAGSALDNARDRDDAGRRTPFLPRGQEHWSARLSQADADRIRHARSLGITVPDLMRLFGVSRATIYAVLSRSRYNADLGQVG